MSLGNSTSIGIAVSGLQAEAMRMKVISNNIANANTSRTDSGEPFRRQDVLLSTSGDQLSGVTIEGLSDDTSSNFQSVYQPGHPDAGLDGYVSMPNVQLPVEMMNLVAASRAYQANAAVLKRYQDMVDVTVELLK